MFHSLFLVLWQSIDIYFTFRFLWIFLCRLPGRQGKVHYSAGSLFSFLFFFFCWLSLDLFVWPRLGDLFVSQNPRESCESHSLGRIGGCAYVVRSNFNFLHKSQCITFLTQLCLVLYPFCANLLHSLIIWLIVSFLSPYNLRLLFCCISSTFALM